MVMALCIFCFEANIGRTDISLDVAFAVTALLGIFLGWQRRSGTVFFAPIVSWFFAWPPLWLGIMVHEGFFKGFFKGLFLITFGWIAIGGAEFLVLLVTSTIVRLLRGKKRDSAAEVVIFGPDDPVH